MHGNEIILRDKVTLLQPYNPDRINTRTLRQAVRRPARAGLFLIVVFVFGFGIWAATVPLAGGAISQGVISPDGSTRTVQHLEGGIINKLHVRDGDFVKKNQPLIVLESIQPQANYDLHRKKQRTLHITRIRLQAERNGEDQLKYPTELTGAGPETTAAIASQQELFRVRRVTYMTRKRILRRRIAQLTEQIKGYDAQVESTSRQLDLIGEEITGKRELEGKGYLPRPELLRLMRMEAEIAGRRGQYLASISQARQQIGEAELQLVANDAERAEYIASKFDQVQTELSALEEKLLASKDVLNRTVITAPVNGTIVNLHFKTEGGVVAPGAPILDIVPADERLVIDARVSPMDIDVVKIGLKAQVQLSSFSTRSLPRVAGVVRSVSADRLIDDTTNQPYYLASVEVESGELERIGLGVDLVPGMPADVLIVTGKRTMAKYLFQPFLDAIWRTFREV